MHLPIFRNQTLKTKYLNLLQEQTFDSEDIAVYTNKMFCYDWNCRDKLISSSFVILLKVRREGLNCCKVLLFCWISFSAKSKNRFNNVEFVKCLPSVPIIYDVTNTNKLFTSSALYFTAFVKSLMARWIGC
jgi:hypothetical protein